MTCTQIGRGYSVSVDNNGVTFNGEFYKFPSDIINKGSINIVNGVVKVGNYMFKDGEWTKWWEPHTKSKKGRVDYRFPIHYNNKIITEEYVEMGNMIVKREKPTKYDPYTSKEKPTPPCNSQYDASKTSLMTKLKNIFK